MIRSLLAIVVFGVISSCSRDLYAQYKSDRPLADTLVEFSVKPAPEWTDLFRRSNGWFGADGVFSMTRNGKETIGAAANDSVLMYFSDTMTGRVVGDTAVQDFKMINNSFAWITSAKPSAQTVRLFYKQGPAGEPLNYFEPRTPLSQPKEYYWFGDGFVNHEDGNSVNIFGYRTFDRSPASWDFEIRGVTLITIPDPTDLSRHDQIDLPLFIDNPGVGKGTFGAGIYVNTREAGAPKPDGFIYVYGVIDPNKQLVVARVKPKDIRTFSAWRFWNGSDWGKDILNVKPVTDRVSNELSLTPLKDGRFLLVFQADGIGTHSAIRIGKTPVGPFGPLQQVWKAPELSDPPGIIPYNAKAHPVLSQGNRLLISYNTISADYFKDILKYPHMYRPRFFWLELK